MFAKGQTVTIAIMQRIGNGRTQFVNCAGVVMASSAKHTKVKLDNGGMEYSRPHNCITPR